MKIKRKAWKAIKAFAHAEGYKGAATNTAVLKWLTEDEGYETLTLKAFGLENLDLKTLDVEVSEDGSQVLITEVAASTEAEDDEEDEDKIEDDEEEEEERTSRFDANELSQKIASEVGRVLATHESKRPAVGLSNIGKVQTVEESRYEDKIARGNAHFKTPFMAKLFALNLCRMLGRKGIGLGVGAETPEVAFTKHDAEYTKMIQSDHPKAKSLRAQAKTYSREQQKAISSATSNLTGIEFSAELIRNVEEFGVAPKLSPIVTMTEMQMEVKRRVTGLTVTYPGENIAATEAAPTYDAILLTAKEGLVLSQMSKMALRSATIDLGDSVMEEHAQAWAEHIDDSYFKGDGTAAFAGRLGLSNTAVAASPFGTTATDGGSVVVGAGTGLVHTAAQLAALIGRIPLYAQRNMVITGLNDFIANTFHRLGQAQGGVTMAEWQGVMVSHYSGFPLVPNFSMDNTTLDSTTDDIDFLAGDFARGTRIGYFGSLEMDTSDQRFWDSNAIGVRSSLAWDHQLADVGTPGVGGRAGPIISFWQT